MKSIYKITLLLLVVATAAMGCRKDPDDPNNPNGGGINSLKYTVTFDANGGSGAMQSQIFRPGSMQALTANAFTREGYTFVSWNTVADASGTSYTDGQEITVVKDITLYAQWKKQVANPLNGHEWVDLGLPSGTLWAKTNIDENIPELYQYYSWGDTYMSDGYTWDMYIHCNGTSTTLTKYCNNASYGYNGFTDNLTTLVPDDDAATAIWGEEWRMPTFVELYELEIFCTSSLVSQNGVNGLLFTAPNGNSIFFPAAGGFIGGSCTEGSEGCIWTSTLNTENPSQACAMVFNADGVHMGYLDRYVGLSIRAVVK